MKIRLRFIDLVVSLFIYAGSIITFAFLHYEKGLDTVISIAIHLQFRIILRNVSRIDFAMEQESEI